MNRFKFTLRDPNTNWKYFLIVILLVFIVGGGILIYQYWGAPQRELEVPGFGKPTIDIEEEFIEVPLDELNEGENKIESVIIEKFTPISLCKSTNQESFEKKEFMGYEYLGIEREQGYYELTCNVENKAKVKIVGWESPPTFIIENFLITDVSNNVINGYDGYFAVGVESLHRNDKIYILITGASGGTAGITDHFLYRIDDEGGIKFISFWGCAEEEYEKPPFKCKSQYEVKYVLFYKNNLYLRIENEIWEIGEDDTVKNKFPANKIIIKDSEISFE